MRHAHDLQHLEHAGGRGQIARPLRPARRHEPIEPGSIALIFGLVHGASRRVHGHRLVREAPEVAQRDRLRRRSGRRVDRHLEVVAMILGVVGRRGVLERFLATDPAAPRRQPPGAIPHGADEAPVLADEPALAVRLDYQGGRATRGEFVVGEGPRAVVRLEPVGENARAGGRAARRTRTQRVARLAVFVIANQQDVAVGPGKRRHPIHRFRRREPVVHRIPFIADHAVMESHRQCEIVAGWAQWAVADPGAALWLAGIRGSRDEGIEESAAEGRRSCRHGGAGKELTSIERGPFRMHAATSGSPAACTPARNGGEGRP